MGSYLSSGTDEDEYWRSDAQHAVEAARYCVVCGGPFDIEGDVYNLDHKQPRYQWLFDFRLLGRKVTINNHRVASEAAEPINTSGIDDIFLSEKCWFNMAGSGYFRVLNESMSGDIWFDALLCPADAKSGTLFPLHEACLETSCRAIECMTTRHNNLGNRPALAILCDMLNVAWQNSSNNNQTNSSTFARNDILHLGSCSSIYGPRSVLALTKLEWWGGEYDRFYTNPLDVPDKLSSFVFDVLLASSSTQEESTCTLEITREPQGIERLPTELLEAICGYVPARSAIALHRASKTLAIKTPLDNTFWRDHLRDGSLHPHIWDLDTKRIEQLRQESKISFSAADWDWRSVAKLLAMKQFPIAGRDPRLDNLPHELWNRCRIWNIIEEQYFLPDGTLRTDRSDSVIGMSKKTDDEVNYEFR